MAKAKYISGFELDVIRIGVKKGHSAREIGNFLGRTRMTIHNHITKMRAAGTLENLPFNFVQDEVNGAMNVKK